MLRGIADSLEEKLQALGFEKEGRFKSHITLARIKSPQHIERLAAKLKQTAVTGSFEVHEIVLFKSTLTREGPVYEKVATSTLTRASTKQE